MSNTKNILDILINDEISYVREAVAKQGYGLDILINDESWRVRKEVAKQCYGLDTIVNDESLIVKEIASRKKMEVRQ